MLIALLGSATAASLLTALFAKASADKNVVIDNIIKERKTWRDKLRDLVLNTSSAFDRKNSSEFLRIEAQLVVLLNPYDTEDLEILESLNRIPKYWEEAELREFMDRVAYLLKHDWERVKQESTTRVSPQTLAHASLIVVLVIVATEYVFAVDPSLQIAKQISIWLAATLYIVAGTSNRPKRAFSPKRIWFWLFNEPFREPYRKRDKR